MASFGSLLPLYNKNGDYLLIIQHSVIRVFWIYVLLFGQVANHFSFIIIKKNRYASPKGPFGESYRLDPLNANLSQGFELDRAETCDLRVLSLLLPWLLIGVKY